MLQNESAEEEEVEHFEDIVEETDDKPTSPLSNKQANDVQAVESDGAAVSDSDSSEDEKESPVSSEDELSDEPDEFLVRDDPEDCSETVSVSSGKQSQVPSEKSSLPGGYNPRHREPSYWSVV